MEYTIDSYDANSLALGVVASAEIHLIAGARRIATTQVDVADYVPQPGHKYLADPAWKEWIQKVEKAGIYPGRCAIGSAHQMGSNQMGSKPSNSVVDGRGRVWGTEGLYVADAVSFLSLFLTLRFPLRLIMILDLLVRFPYRFWSQPYDHCQLEPIPPSVLPARADSRFVCLFSQNMSLSHSIAQFIDQDARTGLSQPVQAQL